MKVVREPVRQRRLLRVRYLEFTLDLSNAIGIIWKSLRDENRLHSLSIQRRCFQEFLDKLPASVGNDWVRQDFVYQGPQSLVQSYRGIVLLMARCLNKTG